MRPNALQTQSRILMRLSAKSREAEGEWSAGSSSTASQSIHKLKRFPESDTQALQESDAPHIADDVERWFAGVDESARTSATRESPNTTIQQVLATTNSRPTREEDERKVVILYKDGRILVTRKTSSPSEKQAERIEEIRTWVDSIRYDEEDGYERLCQELQDFVVKGGTSTVAILGYVLADHSISSWKISDVLQILGAMDHAATYQERRKLLVQMIRDRRTAVRSGAISGLIELGDTAISPVFITRVFEQETVPELKSSLLKLLSRLG